MAQFFIEDLELRGRHVRMRVDVNVPIQDGGGGTKSACASLPSIQYALDQGASVVLMSHLGRPGGRKVAKCLLRPLGERLSELAAHKRSGHA
ncbi:MAG TPA: phosphoglycerate kinase [Deltaproteobacteria bacterium]|jgi:phosphoglycerate kinase|nr:phosphoglycerate kinase [Deltaproteobacteria bacterium]